MRGIYYDGIRDYISIGNLMINYQFTLTAWIRADDGHAIFSANNQDFSRVGSENVFIWAIVDSNEDEEAVQAPVY